MCPEHGRAVGVGERQLGFHLVIFHYILIQSRSWPATSYDRTAPRTCYITPAQNFDQTTNRWRTHFWSGRMREDYSKILRGTPDSLSRGAGMGLQSHSLVIPPVAPERASPALPAAQRSPRAQSRARSPSSTATPIPRQAPSPLVGFEVCASPSSFKLYDSRARLHCHHRPPTED